MLRHTVNTSCKCCKEDRNKKVKKKESKMKKTYIQPTTDVSGAGLPTRLCDATGGNGEGWNPEPEEVKSRPEEKEGRPEWGSLW